MVISKKDAYAQNIIPLFQLNFSPNQIVFQTHPRILLTFSLNLTRDSSEFFIATNCNSLPPQTHYSDQDLNPFFHSLITKPISPWLLSAEHETKEIYSTVHRHITNKINSQKYTFETTQLKQLPLNTFVINTNFKTVKLSHKLKPFRFGPYKILQHLLDVIYELMAQGGSTFHSHRNHISPYFPKEPIIIRYLSLSFNTLSSQTPRY